LSRDCHAQLSGKKNNVEKILASLPRKRTEQIQLQQTNDDAF